MKKEVSTYMSWDKRLINTWCYQLGKAILEVILEVILTNMENGKNQRTIKQTCSHRMDNYTIKPLAATISHLFFFQGRRTPCLSQALIEMKPLSST